MRSAISLGISARYFVTVRSGIGGNRPCATRFAADTAVGLALYDGTNIDKCCYGRHSAGRIQVDRGLQNTRFMPGVNAGILSLLKDRGVRPVDSFDWSVWRFEIVRMGSGTRGKLSNRITHRCRPA